MFLLYPSNNCCILHIMKRHTYPTGGPKMKALIVFTIALLAFASTTFGQKSFVEQVGNVRAQPLQQNAVMPCPFMTWGGDTPLLVANGNNLVTQSGSEYQKLGLNLKFYRENEFSNQVKDYLNGKTPFLRCTYSMLGPASEILNRDQRTQPVVFCFVSWSQGDHLVSRAELHSLNDLKRSGRKIKVAVQQGGAHVGWLYTLLQTVQLSKDDIEIVWCKEMTGPGSPPEAFKADSTIDAAFAISPDMSALTGGLEKTGNGAEGTVKGAHVLVSTVQMTHAIPDIIAVRRDFFEQHPDYVQKFTAGYLNAVDKVVTMRKDFEATHKLSAQYRAVLQLEQDAFGKDMLPSLENDAHGLLMDCVFGGMPGQPEFFDDKGNLSGFNGQMKVTLDMSQAFGYVTTRQGFVNGHLPWQQIATIGELKYVAPTAVVSIPHIKAEALNLFPDSNLDDKTIATFTIHFDPGSADFSAEQYGADFQRALQAASQFPNAVVVVRGHSDPTKTLVDFLRVGLSRGVIKRTGNPGNFQYYLDGQALDISQTQRVTDFIKSGQFNASGLKDGNGHPLDDPRDTMNAAMTLSHSRAQSVKDAIVAMAKQQGTNLDASQIQPLGAGILEPVIAKPHNQQEASQNMRVEFRIIRVPAEAQTPDQFNY